MTSVVHGNRDRAHGHDVYGDRMYEVNEADELDVDFGLDAWIGHRQNGFRRRNEDDIDYYKTEVLWLFSVIVLIVDWICKNRLMERKTEKKFVN